MSKYIQTLDAGQENAFEQISIWALVEYLWATKNYNIENTLEFIRGLVEQNEYLWDEDNLRQVLQMSEDAK